MNRLQELHHKDRRKLPCGELIPPLISSFGYCSSASAGRSPSLGLDLEPRALGRTDSEKPRRLQTMPSSPSRLQARQQLCAS